MANEERDPLVYVINRMERAAQSDDPKNGFGECRHDRQLTAKSLSSCRHRYAVSRTIGQLRITTLYGTARC
jgi:hypothetical protein